MVFVVMGLSVGLGILLAALDHPATGNSAWVQRGAAALLAAWGTVLVTQVILMIGKSFAA